MPDVTKMQKVDRLSGHTLALNIYDSLNVSYWAHDAGDAQYHLDEAHRSFRRLAEKLGYTVTPVTAHAAE